MAHNWKWEKSTWKFVVLLTLNMPYKKQLDAIRATTKFRIKIKP